MSAVEWPREARERVEELEAEVARLRAQAGSRTTGPMGHHLQLVVDATSDLLCLYRVGADGAFRVEAVNEALLAFLGCTRDEALGRRPQDVFAGDIFQPYLDELRQAVEQRTPLRTELAHPGPPPATLEVTLVPVLDAAGRCTHLLSWTRDVTADHELRERLQLSDRLASVGTLAAGVAHEINNPLGYALANLSFVGEELARGEGAGDEVLQALADARDGLERVRRIVRELRVYSRPEREAPTAVELAPVLEASLALVQHDLQQRARLVRQLQPVPPVKGHAACLGQLFVNLLANAVHAIEEGDAEGQRITVATRQRADGQVEVSVADSGRGIAPEVLPRIFEPFFTTKRVGEGTGLGLAVCHGIVRSLGGRLEVQSTVGQGTVFRVLLPPCPREERLAAEPPSQPPVLRAAAS